MDALISGILEYSSIDKNQLKIYDVDLDLIVDQILKTIQLLQKQIYLQLKGINIGCNNCFKI